MILESPVTTRRTSKYASNAVERCEWMSKKVRHWSAQFLFCLCTLEGALVDVDVLRYLTPPCTFCPTPRLFLPQRLYAFQREWTIAVQQRCFLPTCTVDTVHLYSVQLVRCFGKAILPARIGTLRGCHSLSYRLRRAGRNGEGWAQFLLLHQHHTTCPQAHNHCVHSLVNEIKVDSACASISDPFIR